MSIIYRIATDKDIDQLVELFSSDGNPHNWSHKKFHHYYSEYPEGIPISVVADDSGKIVGHFGIFPGQVGSFTVMTSHAAYVNVKYRNTKVIAGIHFEAIRLFFKGIPNFPHSTADEKPNTKSALNNIN